MNLTVDFAESVGTSNLCTSSTKLDTVLLSISLKRIPKLRSSKAAKRPASDWSVGFVEREREFWAQTMRDGEVTT